MNLGIEWNDISLKAKGGTELLGARLENSLSKELLDETQIILSRVRAPLDPTKIRIFWAHDLPDDPESEKALGKRGWANYHKIVAVSNWQMQSYIAKFEIPWSKCIVIPNAIEPIARPPKLFDGPIRFIYHTTPHRGLNILYAVFAELCKHHKNIYLDVYSSFKIYGWPDRDEPFQEIFSQIDAHPNMTNHGSVSNDQVREALGQSDIFAYPSTWCETSCLALIEAMSAGLLCVHPNLGALYETSASWTTMYQYNEDPNAHATWLFQILDQTLKNWGSEMIQTQINNQKSYVDVFHNWIFRKPQWEQMIHSLLKEPRELPQEMYVYRS